jgi:signal transduction histidine kinase
MSQRALLVAALVTAVLTAALALALVTARDRSRHDLEHAFAQRSSISAALVDAVLKQSVDASLTVDARTLSGPRLTDATLQSKVTMPGQSLVVTDARGRVLAGWPAGTAAHGAQLPGALGSAARAIAGGTPFLVRVSPTSEHQISLLTGIDTPHGRRVVATIYPRALMQAFFGPYLSRVSGSGAAAYLVDSAGVLSSGGNRAATLRDLPATGGGTVSTDAGTRRFARAPIAGTDWSVVVTIPPAQLYAPMDGLAAWLPWALLVGMVVMAGFIFLLVRGIARGSTRLAAANCELARRNAEVVAADRMKTDFLATMSHELRTPLNGIIGFAELMHDGRVGPVSDQHREYLGDILASSGHLRSLIDDVLDLSKIEAGKIDLRPEATDCEALVDEVCDVVGSIAVRKRITLETRVDPALGTLELDPGKLKQVLFNYVSNALKFTPEGGSVSVVAVPLPGDRFRITVEDDGPGIPAEDLDHLWSAFRQLDSGSARRYGGSGLGLSLTRSLVEAQGGEVSVESTVGVGSRFHVVLPRVVAAHDIDPALAPTAA